MNIFKKLKQLFCRHYFPGSPHTETVGKVTRCRITCAKCGKIDEQYIMPIR